ncbi:hypothetical protein AGR8A_pAt30116 [Agrobacterium fabrum str. J-07]|nr:hypothetical protein AGR8A_pAt30116 [Agrobacterium fabrum str. J-07]
MRLLRELKGANFVGGDVVVHCRAGNVYDPLPYGIREK